jgi:hypothetical protein
LQQREKGTAAEQARSVAREDQKRGKSEVSGAREEQKRGKSEVSDARKSREGSSARSGGIFFYNMPETC